LLSDSLRDAASRTAPITFPADLHHETQEMRQFDHQQVGLLQAGGVELTAFETYFAIPKERKTSHSAFDNSASIFSNWVAEQA
jgi:hypothetical protein